MKRLMKGLLVGSCLLSILFTHYFGPFMLYHPGASFSISFPRARDFGSDGHPSKAHFLFFPRLTAEEDILRTFYILPITDMKRIGSPSAHSSILPTPWYEEDILRK